MKEENHMMLGLHIYIYTHTHKDICVSEHKILLLTFSFFSVSMEKRAEAQQLTEREAIVKCEGEEREGEWWSWKGGNWSWQSCVTIPMEMPRFLGREREGNQVGAIDQMHACGWWQVGSYIWTSSFCGYHAFNDWYGLHVKLPLLTFSGSYLPFL